MKKTLLVLFLLLAASTSFAFFWLFLRIPQSDQGNSAAVSAGRQLANGHCTGDGPGTLTSLPMKMADFAMIIPYGSVVGGHVTPIDHQYYSPTIFSSPRDTYPVYAMADSHLVDIGPRTNERGTEYRLVFSMSCTFLYYYDLVTSLSPDIQAVYDQKKNSQGYAQNIDIQVSSGQEIGRIGGQTLDFAVWDTTKPLTGFVNPQSYMAEPWKIYTADPLDYATEEIKAQTLAKYLRVVEPRSGKIDYDVDGKLIGNWFLEGTNGYAGQSVTAGGSYYSGHLSIAPDHIDPGVFIASLGDYQGLPQQFSLSRKSLSPADVAVSTGLVKYDLFPWQYLDGKGRMWDRFSFPRNMPLTITNAGFPAQGCLLVQLIEDRRLNMEVFPNKKCSTSLIFTQDAKFYVR